MKSFLSTFAVDLFAQLLALLTFEQMSPIPDVRADPPSMVSMQINEDGQVVIIAQGGTLAVDMDEGEIRDLSFTGP